MKTIREVCAIIFFSKFYWLTILRSTINMELIFVYSVK